MQASLNRFSKRHQRNFYQPEMLAGEGDTNNGNKQNNPETNMYHGSVQPTTKQPGNIAQQTKATGLALSLATCLPRGHHTNPASLKHCNPQGIQTTVMHNIMPPNK